MRVVTASPAVLKLEVANVPVDIVQYPFRPLEPPTEGPGGFPVAGLLDLAAMKLAAIARRGLRRDFWDLDEIVRAGLSPEAAAAGYLRRFKLAEPDLYHVARSLTFFDDAERDPLWPRGLTPARWRGIRARMERVGVMLVGQSG